MKLTFGGKVCFTDGAPVPNVTVRIFDRDAESKQDDDLTINPGLSDEQGRFMVTYDPGRYLDQINLDTSATDSQPFNTGGLHLPDLTDLYLPYLRFDYPFLGRSRQHQAWLVPFQSEFHLPENSPVQFIPSQHGFRFPNSFRGYFMPFSTPAKFARKKVPPSYGLCGGMCCAALDFLLAGRPIPETTKIPSGGTRLQRYLFNRQMDTMGTLGSSIVKVAQWTTLPDDTPLGVQKMTTDEFARLRQRLDDHNPVVLALIYLRARSASELAHMIFKNHQVLAYAYQQDGPDCFTVQVYDPNRPGRDDIALKVQHIPSTGSASGAPRTRLYIEHHIGDRVVPVRGFFSMPYTPIDPPKGL